MSPSRLNVYGPGELALIPGPAIGPPCIVIEVTENRRGNESRPLTKDLIWVKSPLKARSTATVLTPL